MAKRGGLLAFTFFLLLMFLRENGVEASSNGGMMDTVLNAMKVMHSCLSRNTAFYGSSFNLTSLRDPFMISCTFSYRERLAMLYKM